MGTTVHLAKIIDVLYIYTQLKYNKNCIMNILHINLF